MIEGDITDIEQKVKKLFEMIEYGVENVFNKKKE